MMPALSPSTLHRVLADVLRATEIWPKNAKIIRPLIVHRSVDFPNPEFHVFRIAFRLSVVVVACLSRSPCRLLFVILVSLLFVDLSQQRAREADVLPSSLSRAEGWMALGRGFVVGSLREGVPRIACWKETRLEKFSGPCFPVLEKTELGSVHGPDGARSVSQAEEKQTKVVIAFQTSVGFLRKQRFVTRGRSAAFVLLSKGNVFLLC